MIAGLASKAGRRRVSVLMVAADSGSVEAVRATIRTASATHLGAKTCVSFSTVVYLFTRFQVSLLSSITYYFLFGVSFFQVSRTYMHEPNSQTSQACALFCGHECTGVVQWCGVV